MTEKEYRAYPALSNSKMTEVKKILYGDYETDTSKYFGIGSLVDQIILTPELVDITSKYYREALDIANGFYKNCQKEVILMLNASKAQHPVISDIDLERKGTAFNIHAKCLHDAYSSAGISIDLKTTICKNKSSFIEACKHFEYDRQSWWYSKVSGITKKSYIVGIEKNYPYKVYLVDARIHLHMDTDGKKQAIDLALIYKNLFLI